MALTIPGTIVGNTYYTGKGVRNYNPMMTALGGLGGKDPYWQESTKAEQMKLAGYNVIYDDYVPSKSNDPFGSFLASIDPTTAISKAVTNVLQPVEQTISTNLAQLDKDLSLSQNAPLIATIAATIALPGVGASIGNSLLSAGLLPAGTTVATATAVGSGLANAALQVAQGKSPEDALKVGVIGAAGGAVGNYLVGDAGTLKNFGNVIVIQPNSDKKLSKLILELIQSPFILDSIGEQAKVYARENFSWPENAERHIKLYSRLKS
jgi:glycosyltransferase involved in cell wall biosynthesis